MEQIPVRRSYSSGGGRTWWVWIPPGIGILFSVMAVNFVGDDLHDTLDPQTTIR